MDDLSALLRDWATYGPRLKASLNPQPRPIREAGLPGITDAILFEAIPAAQGLVDGAAHVYPLDDDGTGTRTMKIRTDKDKNKVMVLVRNPFAQTFVPNSGDTPRKCQYSNVGGYLKLISVDCPASTS